VAPGSTRSALMTEAKTGGVVLRDVSEDDLPIFFEHQRDPAANRMADFPARDRDAFMAHWTKIMRDATVVTRTVVVEGHVAGNVVCWGPSDDRAVGYWIGRDYWGKGVATRALESFLLLLGTRPLYAHVAKHNLASLRVLQKCGFTISGTAQVASSASSVDVEELILKLDERRGH
jgi:RimJ/RimL family protein N-acetyltransferase